MNIIVISTFMCANIILVGFQRPLTKIDQQTVNRAQVVCQTRYNSCPSSVRKLNDLRYQVVCK